MIVVCPMSKHQAECGVSQIGAPQHGIDNVLVRFLLLVLTLKEQGSFGGQKKEKLWTDKFHEGATTERNGGSRLAALFAQFSGL